MSPVKQAMDRVLEQAVQLHFNKLSLPHPDYHIAESVISSKPPSRAHSHDFYEFFWVRQGRLRYYTERGVEYIDPRSLVFVPPSERHAFSADASGGVVLFTNIAFSTRFLGKVVAYLDHASITKRLQQGFTLSPVPLLFWERLNRNAQQLLARSTRTNPDKAALLRSLIAELALEALEPAYAAAESNLPAWLAKACESMQTAENLRLGLPKFIALSGKSQEHLTRTLQHCLNITPTEFINQKRLRKIEAELKTSRTRIADIALQNGFGNLAHFNKVFRGTFGMTPRDFRNRSGREVVPV